MRALGARARDRSGAASTRSARLGESTSAVSCALRLVPCLMVGMAAGIFALLATAAMGALLGAVGTFAGRVGFRTTAALAVSTSLIMAASEVSASSMS